MLDISRFFGGGDGMGQQGFLGLLGSTNQPFQMGGMGQSPSLPSQSASGFNAPADPASTDDLGMYMADRMSQSQGTPNVGMGGFKDMSNYANLGGLLSMVRSLQQRQQQGPSTRAYQGLLG